MDKDFILKQARSQMNNIVKNTTFNNLQKQNESLSKYFQFLEILNELETAEIEKFTSKRLRLIKPSLPSTIELEENQTISMSDLDIDSTFEKNRENLNPSILKQVFTFERKLRGGVIRELEGGYILPEKMVRDIGLDNLDKVKVTSYKETEMEDEKNLYWFEIVEKVNAPMPNREEYTLCKVEKDFGEFIVRSSHEGDIRVEDIPYDIVIKNEDVLTFNIKEGDIVDIAFYKNNPNYTVKVIYKHDTENAFSENSKSKTSNSSSHDRRNNKSTKQLVERNNVINKSLFKERKVLIVGGATRKSDYKSTFEKVGAEFEQASGDEHRDKLAAMISKAEVVGIAVGQCSHNASIFTVETCKRLGIPFSSTHQEGLQSMLLCVEEAMLKGIKDDLLKINDKAI